MNGVERYIVKKSGMGKVVGARLSAVSVVLVVGDNDGGGGSG